MKTPKTAKRQSSKTINLEYEIKEQEKELALIKEAVEKGNINALNTLKIKVPKSTRRPSAKIPKKLSEKEKERRDELRRLKEVQELAKIQDKLLKRIHSRRTIEPIDKKILTAAQKMYTGNKNKDVFAENLNKECDKLLITTNNFKKNNNVKNKTTINFRDNKRKFSSKKEKEKEVKKAVININQKPNNEIKIKSDKEEDEIYLKLINPEIKQFYEEKTGEIFNFLKEIDLCRYIDCFLKEGYDIYEEFIELPKDFFSKMEKPFLNEEQQEKLFNKLITVNPKRNTIEENKICKKINNLINEIQLTEISEKNETTANINQNTEGNVLKFTSPVIKKEELENSNINIDELEKERSEGFKKAVEEFRNRNQIKNNKISVNSLNTKKETTEKSVTINASSVPIGLDIEIICCWNCLKPIKKENSMVKKYKIEYDNEVLYEQKYFCNEKCIREFEKKKKEQIVCFNCNKVFNFYKGFISYDNQKFCSTICKNKYIELIAKNNEKNEVEEKENENEENELDEEKEESEEYFYDPMEDL